MIIANNLLKEYGICILMLLPNTYQERSLCQQAHEPHMLLVTWQMYDCLKM
jgi:hypothetical protein